MPKTDRKYSLFLDTTLNKVDAKGRVSIPADFRALVEQKETQLTAFRSFNQPCIECRTSEMMEKMANDIENSLDPFSDEQNDLTDLIFADAKEFPFDSTGRIVLTEKLMKHAGIADKALFVGKGKTFQIWNPDTYESEAEKRRERALAERFSLKQKGGSDD